ncbi:MAG: alpha-hydroxy-acid oxidizing protein [Lachnospiraceae bacterium]|nr:alpha-hydroxy-acid oxidizing protein [Lachnospiraceae bacterium]
MTAKTDELTREYFNSIMVTPRYIDSDLPNLSVNLFGHEFSTPVMTAALSHLNNICEDGMVEFAKGAKSCNALHFVGMGEDDELERIINTGAKTVKIIKPHERDGEVFRKIKHARENGAFAVGMDIDHAISWKGEYDVVLGLPMRPKTLEQMKAFVKASELPFIVKGVLSPQDAEKCVEMGASAIIISHHHGIMDSMVPPLMILPEIKKAVDGKLKIFVDCGFESGMDAFKALALGADAVGVGRALMDPLKTGAFGVEAKIQQINSELSTVMARTGAKTVSEIDPSVLRFRKF